MPDHPTDQFALLTISEAARVLRVGRTKVYALLKVGELRAVHIGRSCRISRRELERYVRFLETPEPAPSRSPARKRRRTDQSGLFELTPDPADEP